MGWPQRGRAEPEADGGLARHKRANAPSPGQERPFALLLPVPPPPAAKQLNSTLASPLRLSPLPLPLFCCSAERLCATTDEQAAVGQFAVPKVLYSY